MPILDFQGYVDDRAQGFTGREWVFARVDEWLGRDGPRSFLLTAEPGSGKSAFASRLFQIAHGQRPAEDGSRHLTPGFLSAAHFCSARAQSWITPHAFTESITLQLAHHPGFARALAERSGDRQVRITVRQEIGEAQGAVTGVVIERLDLSGIAPEDGFVRAVREPLEALLAEDPDLRVCILVDALDEALLYSGPVGIVTLLAQTADLSERVRFILTSRPDERIENSFREAQTLHMSGDAFAEQNQDDVRRYVSGRLQSDERLVPQVAAIGTKAATSIADTLTERASGNFQYVRFLLNAVADGLRPLDAVEGLPVGLNGLYLDSLERVVKLGAGSWVTAYAPIVGVLSVAREGLSLAKLRALSGQKDPDFWKHRGDLRQFVEVVQAAEGEDDRYRLYHQSFTDFVRLPELNVGGRKLTNPFFLPAAEWHERIADYYLRQYGGYWTDCDDAYGLYFVATHLVEASQAGDRLERHRRIARSVGLIMDPEFQAAHYRTFEDLPALQSDVARALACAATDRHPEAVPLVVEAATSLMAVRRRYHRPGVPFELARAGKLEAAERRLALYGSDLAWRQAILLTLAWLAAPIDRAAAKALRDRVAAEGVAPPLDLLVARLDVDLSGAPPPVLPMLPPAPDHSYVAGILDRIAGGGNNATGIEPLVLEHVEAIHADPDSAAAYLAEQDGPPLVAYAAHDPAENTRYFQQYVAVQAVNSYLHYRNRSLWALVAPVLAHPDPAWVRGMLVELAQATLADTRIDFREGLPLALQAAREKVGIRSPVPTFQDQVARAKQEASMLPEPARGEGDPWGQHLRRLVVLAEIEAVILADREEAERLLEQAKALPFGFAGFRAQACMALEEATSICQPDNPAALDAAFEQALRAAHNIQDYVLCGRATSRLNAMLLRWRKTAPERLDVAALVERFVSAPDDPEFAAIHVVGEQYELRVDTPQRLHIPGWARRAATMDGLSRLYQRTRAQLQQVNRDPGWDPEAILAPGTAVNIPDPEFTALLAARLAAEALTSSALSARKRIELIQSLAPLAVANPTALDLVLTRLLFAAIPMDARNLERLGDSVQRNLAETEESPAPKVSLPPPGVPA